MLLSVTAWAHTPASAGDDSPVEVVGIRVEGNRQVSTEVILSNVRLRVGADYDGQTVRQDRQRLLKTGRFNSVDVRKLQRPDGVIVTFVIDERPLVAGIWFRGNNSIGDGELSGVLPFGPQDPLDRVKIMMTGRGAILDRYKSEGFSSTEVRAEITDDNRVVYHITEGPRTRVVDLEFEGNEYFSDWRLKREIGTSEHVWMVSQGVFDPDQIERDVTAIRNLYVRVGFLGVEVGRILEFSPDRSEVTVRFVINENHRYRVEEIVFRGNEVFSDEELASRLPIGVGDFLTSQEFRQALEILQDTYGEMGFIDARIEGDHVFTDTPGMVSLVFVIVEGRQFRLGRIDIRGNTVTQSRVIRRDLTLYPGGVFNTVAQEESRRRLVETGLFQEVRITPMAPRDSERDVLVEVGEARTAQFLIGAGITTNSGVLGTLSFSERNFDILAWPTSRDDWMSGRAFRGAGQKFKLVAEPGTELMRFHVDWTEPYLFDKPYRLSTRAFLFTRGRESYDETRYGGVVSLGHRFKNRWYGEVAARIEGVDITDLYSDAPPEVIAVSGTNVLYGIKGSLVRDRTDSRWRPSSGDRFNLSYEQVVGDFEFGKAIGEYRIYRTIHVDALDRKHIIAGRFTVGNIFGDAPVFERFYGGGMGSVRGFEYRGISPRSAGTDEEIGGDFMVFAGGEYSFPLIGSQEGSEVRGVLFVDSGTVEDQFEITTYRVSAGAGIRWIIRPGGVSAAQSPMGIFPISLNVAAPLVKDDQDEEQIFNFSVGWMF